VGLIKNMLVRNKLISLADFEKDFYGRHYGGVKSDSGMVINEETAMRFTAVFACIRIISEDIGMLPLEIRRWRDPRNKGKGSDLAYDMPLYDMMLFKPNAEMDSMTFDETIQGHVLSSGNGYAYKEIDSRGRVTGLKLLNWQSITPARDEKTGEVIYEMYQQNGEPLKFKQWEVFHLAGLGFDGIQGYSPINMAMQAIGLGLASEKFAGKFFGKGATISGILQMPGTVKDKEGTLKEFNEKYGSVGSEYSTLLLEEGAKFVPVTMPLAEAQFIEGRRFQKEEIASIYRMPLNMLQDLTHLTYSNAEHNDLAYVKRTLLPWARRWEQAVDTQLMTRRDRELGYFSRVDFDEMLRGDSITRANVNHQRRQDGIITTNEWRVMDGMNPRDEPEADRLVINGNMREISIVNSTGPVEGQQFKKQGGDEGDE